MGILPLCLPPQSTGFAPTTKESRLQCQDAQPDARRSPWNSFRGLPPSLVRAIERLLLGVPCGLVTPFGLVPVYDFPPRVYVLGAPVLILQVVGVLPHVQPNHRRLAFHERCVLVRCGLYGE